MNHENPSESEQILSKLAERDDDYVGSWKIGGLVMGISRRYYRYLKNRTEGDLADRIKLFDVAVRYEDWKAGKAPT